MIRFFREIQLLYVMSSLQTKNIYFKSKSKFILNRPQIRKYWVTGKQYSLSKAIVSRLKFREKKLFQSLTIRTLRQLVGQRNTVPFEGGIKELFIRALLKCNNSFQLSPVKNVIKISFSLPDFRDAVVSFKYRLKKKKKKISDQSRSIREKETKASSCQNSRKEFHQFWDQGAHASGLARTSGDFQLSKVQRNIPVTSYTSPKQGRDGTTLS